MDLIRKRQLFNDEGNWYKGNLHLHTTRSDGKISPEDAIRLYQKAGYDFLALTDHWVQSTDGFEGGLLMLPGCEFNVGDMVDYPIYHIVGIGMKQRVELTRSLTLPPQTVIDAIRNAGGIAILAHPAWSVTIPEACARLQGLAGVEIYNTTSGLPWNARPDSSVYIDIWASQGLMVPCFAADDAHWYNGDQTRSYIMVNARDLTKESLIKAIEQGHFYASQGPRFESISIDGNVIRVECSQVETILFYSNTIYCGDRVATGQLTQAVYEIKPTDTYVRVELIDAEGNRAWCSPFSVRRQDV